MSFSLSDLNPLKAITDVVGTVIDRVIPDKNAQAEAKAELLKMQMSGELAQISAQTDINKIEAASPNMFIAGWRPSVGWCCSAGLAIQFIVRPFFIWGSAIVGHATDFPSLDMGTLMALLLALLGMGSMRTTEKIQGVEGNR